MISIIIPIYNQADKLSSCLDSILKQTYKNYEVIIVDNGSDDDPRKIAEDYRNKLKIEFYNPKILRNAPAARNRGFKKSKGEYLFFCDADIILRNDALEILKEALEINPEASYSYSSFKLGWKKFASRSFDAEVLKKFNYISTMSLIRKEGFVGFDEKLKKFQDWDLWLSMLERGGLGVLVPQILFYAKPSRHGKSKWFPSFFYKIPWKKFGIRIRALEEYQWALDIIKKKHNL